MISATLYGLLGAFQFSSAFRLRWPGLHRRAAKWLAVRAHRSSHGLLDDCLLSELPEPRTDVFVVPDPQARVISDGTR